MIKQGYFKFSKDKEIFVYAESEAVSFKAKVKSCGDIYIICQAPPVLHILPANLFENIQIIEKEDEAANVHKRRSARRAAKPGQLAGIVRTNDIPKGKSLRDLDQELFVLNDISTGGMSILVDDPGEFDVGEKVSVIAIDGKLLPRPLQGDVKSVRKLDGDLDQFKVGVKFE